MEDTNQKDLEETLVEVEQEEEIILADDLQASPLTGISDESFSQLTKRNRDFMLQLNRFVADGLTDEAKEPIYQEMVDTLLQGQRTGQTARQLYGTPTEVAEMVVNEYHHVGDDAAVSPNWQIALDGGLLLGSFFTIITGFSLMNAESNDVEMTSNVMGIVTLIVNYIVAGLTMLITSKNLPDFEAEKGKRGYWRYFFVSIASMALWFLAISLTQVLLPRTINPALPGVVYLVVGIVTLVARYFLKKHLNIRGGVFN